MNTIIYYKHKDSDIRNQVIVKGELEIGFAYPKQTRADMVYIDKIKLSLLEGKYFDPYKVGIPVNEDGLYEFIGMKSTDLCVTKNTTIRKLANKFEEVGKTGWK